jgi:hypothetical protein
LLVTTSSSWSSPIPLASWAMRFVLKSSISFTTGSRPLPQWCRRCRPSLAP